MNISYSLTRFEIVRTFLYVIPRSPRIRTVVFIIFAGQGFFFWFSTRGTFSRRLSIRDVFGEIVWMVGAFFLILLWIFIRAKSKARTLSISEQGIHTEIGRIKADYPWTKVKEIKDVGSYILVVNRSGNAFFIPNRAFSDTNQRAEFVLRLNQWCPRG